MAINIDDFERHDMAIIKVSGSLGTRTISLHGSNDMAVGEQVAFAGYGRTEDDPCRSA